MAEPASASASRRASVAPLAALIVAALVAVPRSIAPVSAAPGVSVRIAPDEIRVRNGVVSRTWRQTDGGFLTTSFRDLRTGREWTAPGGSPDFTVRVGGVDLTSADFRLEGAVREGLAHGGIRVRMLLFSTPFVVEYIVDAYPGVAGFRTQTVLQAQDALLSGYSLGELTTGLGDALVPIGQTFHSGSDWRDEEDWEPQLQVGGEDTPRGGRSDWRVQTEGPPGGPYEQNGAWISIRHRDGSSAFVVGERVNLPSSRVSYADGRVAAVADLSRDVIITGPIESDVHVENPTPVPVRHRVITERLALEPAFVGLSTSPDDEAWQHAKYLQAAGWPHRREISFNTNTIDDDSLPSNSPGGAKDSVDQKEFFRQLRNAHAVGVETFVLDDGWQLNAGDWEPDPSRFPDGFAPIRRALGARRMGLGLWMSPMSFHPAASAFRRNPGWSCAPAGTATGAANATPAGEAFLGGSAEAGIGVWNPLGEGIDGRQIDDLARKIERAITEYGSRYFKFDFMVWLDCVNASPVDKYLYRETFRNMVDGLHARFPHVTFQIDETNDYRMWPFESALRGPSWFQNGSPPMNRLLHNLWLVAPYVPTSTIGQATLGEGHVELPDDGDPDQDPERVEYRDHYGVDYMMAVALLSHMTFWRDMTTLTPAQVRRARFWTDLYKRIRPELVSAVTYPLLGDPMEGKTWVGLQPWNVDRQRGFLFAFRQDTGSVTARMPLRGLRAGRTYVVRDVITGRLLGRYSAAQLRAGLTVSASRRHGARVLRIEAVR